MATTLSVIDVWKTIDVSIQEKLGRVSYSTFQKTVRPVSFMENTLIVSVPNNFMKKWLLDKCDFFIKQAVKTSYELLIDLQIKIIDTDNEEEKPAISNYTNNHSVSQDRIESNPISVKNIQTFDAPIKRAPSLNAKYTFDNFVVGPCNRFPHAAAVAVSKAPGKAYNPMFLYGGVGLGKTHLMHAIGNKVMENYPHLNVLYITAEDFTNDLITSIQNGKILNFRDKYRNVDVLMVDDIQFISGKEKTEEEFFHTFNYLHQLDKQIILSSDRLPKDIPSIEERLKSRFEWGLSADLQAPDLETRVAILSKKLEPELQTLPKDVLFYIASQIPENIRELEGALIKIIAYASLINQQITITLAKDVIKDIVKDKSKKPISLSKIKKIVADYYEIDADSITAKIRTKEIAHARQVAMFLCREMTNYSLPKIGENFGKRDHTTVMHACDKIRTEMKKNHDLKSVINQLKQMLQE